MDAAERLVRASAGKRMPQSEAEALRADVAGTLAAAQVHATLALAAASAQNIRRNGALEGGTEDWPDVLRGAK
jgi:hypothetical protein